MRARLATAVLVVSLAASGCTGDEDPDAGPTLPPITETPSASPEAVPSEANEATPEGAAEFVRLFYETIEDAYQSQDASRVQALSDDNCKGCAAFIDTINGLRPDGASVRDDYSVDIVSVEAPSLGPGQSELTASVLLNVSEFERIGPDGEPTTTEPALDGLVQNVTLRRQGQSWVVVEVTKA